MKTKKFDPNFVVLANGLCKAVAEFDRAKTSQEKKELTSEGNRLVAGIKHVLKSK